MDKPAMNAMPTTAKPSSLEQSGRSISWILLFLVGLIILATVLFTFPDYGITWDEDWHLTYGDHIVRWYLTGFQDRSALTYWTLPLQAGLPGVVASLGARLMGFGRFESAHLVIALFGLSGVIAVYKLGELLGGRRTGVLSSLFLLVTPRYYGHMFNNLVDIPFAALSAWALFILIQTIPSFPKPSLRQLAKLAITIGLALAVRTGGILLVGYVGLAIVLWLGWDLLNSRGEPLLNPRVRQVALRLGISFVGFCALAYLVMLIFWPAAQVRPLVQPAKGLLYATRFEYSFDVFFEGQQISNKELPWYFLPLWLAISLPEYYFLGLLAGAITLVRAVRHPRWQMNPGDINRVLGLIILAVAILLPLGYTIITRPANYDSLRHYLFLIPPLAVMASLPLGSWIGRARPSIAFYALLGILGGSFLLTAVDMIQLHPYQYIYFNRLFGKGLSQAAQLYETEYWGSSYKEGVEWVVAHAGSPPTRARLQIASCGHSTSTAYFLPADGFEYLGSYHDGQAVPEGAHPDLLLATTRWDCHTRLPGNVMHIVERMGVPLLYIIQTSPAALTHPGGSGS